MSITKAAADLLASGFLDEQAKGLENKSILRPKNTYSVLFQLAGELIDSAQKNLHADNSNASGGLSKSLVLGEPRKSGSKLEVDIEMAEHGLYINSGVKGTKSGAGKYQFKSEFPSSKMLANLQRSKIRAKRSTGNSSAKKTTRANEKKNTKISEISVWGAARNIKMYGIKATGFLDNAVNTTEKSAADKLGEAFSIDVINSI